MMNQKILFNENIYDIREQACSTIVLAKKKIILPEMDKKNITVVNNTNGIIITDSMEMINALLLEQSQFAKTRQEKLEMAFLPHVITSTDGNEHNTDLISYDMIKNRVIYLNGEVNGESALFIITQLRCTLYVI